MRKVVLMKHGMGKRKIVHILKVTRAKINVKYGFYIKYGGIDLLIIMCTN